MKRIELPILDQPRVEQQRPRDELPAAAPDLLAEVAEASAPARQRELALPGETDRAAPAVPALRSALLLAVDGPDATIAWRGSCDKLRALVADGVDAELLLDARASGQPVLVECAPGETPIVVGVLTTKKPERLALCARSIELRAEQEILLRSGKSGILLRRDGEIELVGSRISAVSRGLMRLVGRMLRLN